MARPGERGSALLDVLLALALTALLAGAAGAIVRHGLLVVERAEARSAAGGGALALRRELAELLSRMDAATPEGGPTAIGGAEGFRWRGPDPADGAAIWLRLSPDLAMARCEGPAGPCGDPGPGRGAARFAYLDDEGAWRADWPLAGPPALVRIETETAEIVVAPRVAGARR